MSADFASSTNKGALLGFSRQEAAQEDAQAQAQEDAESHQVAAPHEVA
jgi:hypothetical protein